MNAWSSPNFIYITAMELSLLPYTLLKDRLAIFTSTHDKPIATEKQASYPTTVAKKEKTDKLQTNPLNFILLTLIYGGINVKHYDIFFKDLVSVR